MAFSGATYRLPYIRNYEEALKWWSTHPKPPRSKKWEDYQRPLYNTASTHYRLESMRPEEYIDVVLYRTVMARYYAPTPDGKQRRLYMGDGSITSRSFMCYVLGITPWRNTERKPDGSVVIAPIYCRSFMSDGGHAFSADFMFDADNKLLVDESRHTKHWRRVSNECDKAKRAHIRELFKPYLDLAMFRMAEFEAKVDFDYRAGQPFGAKDNYNAERGVDRMYKALVSNELPEQEDINHFFDMAQCVFDVLASKRGYQQDGFNMGDYWSKKRGDARSTYADLTKPITGNDLRKALADKVVKLCGANQQTGHLPIPQFPSTDDCPHSNVFVTETP